MSTRDSVFLSILGSIVVLSVIAHNHTAHAAKFQLVPGETYVFVVDCLPHILMPTGTMPDGTVTRANPCFVEKMTVKSVSDDGWVEAHDPEDTSRTPQIWRINLARVYAVTKADSPTRRAA